MNSAADLWMDIGVDPTACPVCGRDACDEHLTAAHMPADTIQVSTGSHLPKAAVERARLRAIRALEAMSLPRPEEIIEGLLWADSLTVFVGESGAGKTFVVSSAAAAVSDGSPWHGRHIRHGSVVYFAFEGDAIAVRLRALRDVAGHRLEHLYIVRASDPISPRITRDGEERSMGELLATEALTELAATLAATGLPPIVFIVVDTVRASMAGSEDSSEHTAAYIRAVRRLMATVPGAGAMLVHHAGWQDGESTRKRERGSSAWRGNCDATFYLEAGDYDAERGETPLTLRALKVRDAEKPAPLHLVRRRVELNEMDAHGQPVTSCVIEPDRRTVADRTAEATAAVEREHRARDLDVLRTITEKPELATSQDTLRVALGVRKSLVSDSLSRLTRAGWVLPGRRNQPYTVTPEGRQALQGPHV